MKKIREETSLKEEAKECKKKNRRNKGDKKEGRQKGERREEEKVKKYDGLKIKKRGEKDKEVGRKEHWHRN